MKQEPDATARTAAKALRNMYVALCDEGFTASEALVIIGQCLAATQGKGDS